MVNQVDPGLSLMVEEIDAGMSHDGTYVARTGGTASMSAGFFVAAILAFSMVQTVSSGPLNDVGGVVDTMTASAQKRKETVVTSAPLEHIIMGVVDPLNSVSQGGQTEEVTVMPHKGMAAPILSLAEYRVTRAVAAVGLALTGIAGVVWAIHGDWPNVALVSVGVLGFTMAIKVARDLYTTK